MTQDEKREAFLRVVSQVRAIAPKTWCGVACEAVQAMLRDQRKADQCYTELVAQRDRAQASIAGLNAGGCFQSKPFCILR